jgi:hypothetical protein
MEYGRLSASNKNSYRSHAARYRSLALQARGQSVGTTSKQTKAALSDIAGDYEKLAMKMDDLSEAHDALARRRS